MGLVDKLKEISQNLARLVFDPQRLERPVLRFNEIGVKAQIEWMPPSDLLAMPRSGRTICIGRLKVDAPPISRFEVFILRSDSDSPTGIAEYEHHYILDVASAAPAQRVRARRVPQRRYWLFGPVIGHV